MDEPSSVSHGDELSRHGRFLRALARGLVSQPDRADDLVQDTWVVALQRPARHGGAPRSWLARVLRSLAVTQGKREGERPSREAVAARPESSAASSDHAAGFRGAPELHEPSDIAAELELQRRVYECVAALREPYRTTLYLRFYRGLGPQAIAARERIPEKTVKTRLARGLALLREDLDRLYGGVRAHWVALLLPLARGMPPVPSELAPAQESAPLVLGAPASVAGGIALALAVGAASAAFLLWRPDAPPALDADHDVAPPVALGPSSIPPALDAPGDAARTALGSAATIAAAPAPARTLVHGSVLDRLGRPLVGAEVSIESLRGRRGEGRSREDRSSVEAGVASGTEAGTEAGTVETRTDSAGLFALELAEPGLVRLEVELDGFAPHGERLLVFPGQDLDRDAIVLVPGVWLEGLVLDPDGAPTAGVRVWQARIDAGIAYGTADTREVLVARTNESGFFRVARQAVGPWSLVLESDLHAIARVSGETERAGERVDDIDVALSADAAIHGRVIGGLDPLLERLRVVARPSGAERGSGRGARRASRSREADVAADGSFSLRGLEADLVVDLVVERMDLAGHRIMASEPQGAVAGETTVELELEPRASFELLVVDRSTGLPLEDAEVRIDLPAPPRRGSDAFFSERGPGGSLRGDGSLASLGSGGAGILVRSTGYVTRRLDPPDFARGVHVDLGVVALEPAAPLSIEVRARSSGAAIPGACVDSLEIERGSAPGRGGLLARPSAEALIDEPQLGISSTRTDETGDCAIAGEPGREVELVVRAAGYVEHAAAFTFPDAGAEPHRILLERGGAVDLELSSADGAELGGALVAHVERVERDANTPRRGWLTGARVRAAGPSGRVSFEQLAPGRHAFRLVDAELSRAAALDDAGWTEVEVSEGTRAGVRLVAEPAVWLSGSLRRSGAPLAGAQVLVRAAERGRGLGARRGESRDARSALTDDAGRFEIDGLASGEQRLEIRHDSYLLSLRRTVGLHAGANEIVLDLEELRIAGTVRDEDGSAIGGARLRLLAAEELEDDTGDVPFAEPRREGSLEGVVHSDAAGRFECVTLGPIERFALEVSAEGRASQRHVSEEMTAGAALPELELVLGPEARIDLVLDRSEDGPPLGCLAVLKQIGGGSSPAPTQSLYLRAPGTRSITGLQAGSWSIELFERTRADGTTPQPLASRSIELLAGETTSLRIALL